MRKAIIIIIFSCSFLFSGSAQAFTPAYKFTDQLHDIESNLYYYDNRYYDPQAGRFTQPDPMVQHNATELLADPQSLNPYAYARNNPIKYIDPTGLSTATFNPIPEGGWQFGQEMGQFNGVTAYYNGIGNDSIAYSCVNYAKRYMSEVYDIDSMGKVENAKSMWGMVDTINERLSDSGSSYSFVQYMNGEGFNLPGEGDLLFWTEGTYGHVMVVTESIFDGATGIGHVEVIDQNADNQAVRNLNIFRNDTGYSITHKVGSNDVPVAGWFSPIKNSAPANTYSNSTPTPAPVPQPQSSFFQNIWERTKSFFKKFF